MSELIDSIFAAGIIGCGGAGFPTHVKLAGGAKRLILNGAECEPLLRTDRYVMLHYADKVIRAASAVRMELGGIPCTVALKAAYREETAALSKAIEEIDPEIEIFGLETFYPAGDEQVIVAEVTGSVVPPAGIPLDVGCVVSNVTTMYCIANAMDGLPFTRKILTVNGLVAKPQVIRVSVGTSFAECISLCGGATDENYIVVAGGPMMGKRMTKEEASCARVGKTTSGILVLSDTGYIGNTMKISVEHMLNRAKAACIQCSLCTQLCPRNLLGHPLEPHKIMRKMACSNDIHELLDDPDIRRAALCCECGVCEIYACPMSIQPRRVNALLKSELAKAGIRYPKGEGQTDVSSMRDSRRVPTRRAASRAGALKFFDACPTDDMLTYTPRSVEIALKQGAGAPSVPVVRDGAKVSEGDLIAECPKGKLGSNVHASIAGTVTVRSDSICIDGEDK
jgi:Na+-translocating ferredoxin:NAD+ oxidoreductase RnfC subunit